MKFRSSLILLVLSLLVASGCIRLGFWQLDRLSVRRLRNADAVERMALPPLDPAVAPVGPVVERFRRMRLTGRFDFTREVALTGRARMGSPGVHIATPFLRDGSDTIVIVLRGWAYSPDASTLDFARWRERDSATVEGYALPYDTTATGPDSLSDARSVRRLDQATLERRMGAPVAAYYVVMTAGGETGDSVPPRLPTPALDEGPHMSYAMQWFLFATIFGVGGAFVALRGRRTPSPGRAQ